MLVQKNAVHQLADLRDLAFIRCGASFIPVPQCGIRCVYEVEREAQTEFLTCTIKSAPCKKLAFYKCPINTSLIKSFCQGILFTLFHRNYHTSESSFQGSVRFSYRIVQFWLDALLPIISRRKNYTLLRIFWHDCSIVHRQLIPD